MVTASDAKTANWVCAALSLVILFVRFVATRYRDKRFDLASALVGASIAVLIARIVVVYLYLLYGTSNDVLSGKKSYFDDSDLRTIKAGSILAVVARILITTFYWLQISLLLLFYSNLVRDIHWKHTIKVSWALVVATYVAVVLASVLECHPFKLYWQISPAPGQCVHAYTQLYVQGISNIVLDLCLLAISYPLLNFKNKSWSQTLRVGLLFILGFFTIIVTCVRLAYIHGENSFQPVRSFWASVQMFTSTFVANAPIIYGCWQVVHRRKSEQRTRRMTQPELWLPLSTSPAHSDAPQSPTIAHMRTRDSVADDEKAWSRHVS